MSPDLVFQIVNTLVLPQWLLMLAAPRWAPTQWLMKTLVIPALLAVLYIVYLFFGGSGLNFQSFSTLTGVKSLFTQDTGLLAGWIHYLAFDLAVGSFILRSSQRRAVPHAWMIPCLLFCFMLGPVGLLLYLIIRSFQASKKR